MNDLSVRDYNGVFVIDSREVAEMVEKRHDHLLRDINGYVEILNNSTAPKIGASDFFIPSTYQDSTGRLLPCYFLTRKGCDMVANKMTGAKGVLFTATYVTKFEEMEKALKQQPLQLAVPQSFSEALRLAADLYDENKLLLPKAEVYDQFMSADNTKTLTEVAKAIGIGRNKFCQLLRAYNILNKNNIPYQSYMDRGYFTVIEVPVSYSRTNNQQARVTPKGEEYLAKFVREIKEVIV
jgi:Rha family phage regulatory protein